MRLADVMGLGVALAVGLLIGLERERAKPSRTPRTAGVRTFSLVGLAGAVAALVGPEGTYVAGFFLSLVAVARRLRAARSDGGLTTEVAMLGTLLLGALAMRSPALAGGTGVIVATLLANRRRLHRLSRQWLSGRELHDLLTLAAAAFVIMPLLPDRAVDPWGALNPHRLWTLVVAVMAIGSLGYLSLRTFGLRFGLSLAGLAGGFASSIATVALMGQRARDTPRLAPAAASAALMSNVATVVQLAVVIGTPSPNLLARLALPMLAAAALVVMAAAAVGWRALHDAPPQATPLGDRPFELGTALRFGALLGTVLLATSIARDVWGAASVPWTMALSGLIDVHAAAASMAQAFATDATPLRVARTGVFIALASNALLKCAFACWRGGRAYALRVVPGIAAMVAAFALVSWVTA
ncbi:MgtC/SapB family protein [Luteibacter sahnii]|uniref:MgtC/SapB family protein n=1 Tax=Luteibacter sahnii TaxID=3021977 RepID=UPI002A69C830|nr:DUF4010 domain-containing protein [Luteibacter sp. PPL193]MDY1546962.1 DUF4010 domain-containing protein [Luteibacter sp. PPL193]